MRFFINVSGFKVGPNFLIKELCVYDFATDQVTFKYCKLPLEYDELTARQKYHVNWLYIYVHSLYFCNGAADEEWTQAECLAYMREIYDIAESEGAYVGYKGGHLIRHIYRSLLGVDTKRDCTFNVELIDCPRIERLVEETFDEDRSPLTPCRKHRVVYFVAPNDAWSSSCPNDTVIVRCSRTLVHWYGYFLKTHRSRFLVERKYM